MGVGQRKSSVSGRASVSGPFKSTMLALLQRQVETLDHELGREIWGKARGVASLAEVSATSLDKHA